MSTAYVYPGTGVHQWALKIKYTRIAQWLQETQEIPKPNTCIYALYNDSVPALCEIGGFDEQTAAEKNPEISVRLIVDSRFFEVLKMPTKAADMLAATIPARAEDYSPDGAVLPELRGIRPTDEHVSALVIDLGNTRTFALLLDDIYKPEIAGNMVSCVQPLELASIMGPGGSRQQNQDEGVFDSLVILENSTQEKVSKIALSRNLCPHRFARPLSFLRVGGEAGKLQRAILGLGGGTGLHGLSSPKRYFWDHDPESREWSAYARESRNFAIPASPLLELLLQDHGKSPQTMPRSALLAGLAIELFEQAETQVNRPVPYDGNRRPGPRRIRHVCITSPPAWSTSERNLYRAVLEKGLSTFCHDRKLPLPELYMDCEEASGALLAYIANEVGKFGGNLMDWLKLMGRQDKGQQKLRIAVIDIGGGTSDLLIVDTNAMRSPNGATDLKIQRCYQDGVLTAGDELIRAVTCRFVLPAIAKAIAENNEKTRGILFDYLLLDQNVPDAILKQRRFWARQLWFPLTIDLLRHWLEGTTLSRDDWGKLPGEVQNFCDACGAGIAKKKLDPLVFQTNAETIFEKFSKIKPEKKELITLCQSVFSDTAWRFSAAVAAFDCDLVLLAGKTAEIEPVRDLFTREIPLPSRRLLSFGNYRLDRSWSRFSGNNGKLRDAKMATVMGAAIYLLHHLRVPTTLGGSTDVYMKDAPSRSADRQYWGVVTEGNTTFHNDEALFRPDDTQQVVRLALRCRSMLIARRCVKWELQPAQIAYELRLRPGVSGAPDGTVTIERRRTPDGECELHLGTECQGELVAGKDRARLLIEHLELRPRVAQMSAFWTDSGDLGEEIDWTKFD